MARGVWGPARSFVRWSLPSPTTRAGPPATGSGRSRPGFLFPDRHNPLDFVHRPCAGGERFRAVDGGTGDRDRIAADGYPADPVHDRHRDHAELRLRHVDEIREGPNRHGLVDLVVERVDIGVGADGPEEHRDRARLVASDAVDDGLHVDRTALDPNHSKPPLTGGRSATSSPSRKTTSACAYARFTARNIVSRWPRSRGYASTTASTSAPRVAPSRRVQASCRTPTISRYDAKSFTCTRMARLRMAGRAIRASRHGGTTFAGISAPFLRGAAAARSTDASWASGSFWRGPPRPAGPRGRKGWAPPPPRSPSC